MYFVITGAYAGRDHKTVVCSLQHGLLLQQGYVHAQGFSVVNPPPVADGFAALYASARAAGVAVPINPTAADLPDRYPISPDRIKAVDLQLLNELLTLITSAGRRMDYARRATNSGLRLIELFHQEKNRGVSHIIVIGIAQGYHTSLPTALPKKR